MRAKISLSNFTEQINTVLNKNVLQTAEIYMMKTDKT